MVATPFSVFLFALFCPLERVFAGSALMSSRGGWAECWYCLGIAEAKWLSRVVVAGIRFLHHSINSVSISFSFDSTFFGITLCNPNILV